MSNKDILHQLYCNKSNSKKMLLIEGGTFKFRALYFECLLSFCCNSLLGNLVMQLGTIGAHSGPSWGTKLKTPGHSWGTVGAQLGHTVTWGTVEAIPVGAQLGHS